MIVSFLSGAVAQLEERVVRNDEVGGSNPLGSTILPFPLPFFAKRPCRERPVFAFHSTFRFGTYL